MRRDTIVGLLTGLALVLAACGGDGDAEESAESTTSTPAISLGARTTEEAMIRSRSSGSSASRRTVT